MLLRGTNTAAWTTGRTNSTCTPHHVVVRQRRIEARYRTDELTAAFADAVPTAVPLAQLTLDSQVMSHLRRPTGQENFQSLSRLATTNQSYEVLEALSRSALVLRDSAVTAYQGGGSTQSMQALFQNGYDTLVALLQALPQCINAYTPAAMVPETSVTLFHIHNLLLQAAFVSHQEFDVWTELMQAGLGLYLLRAPRDLLAFSDAQLECVMDAMGRQDLWRFQGLIWERMLPSISTWDCLEDLTSVVETCELQAQAAATAAVAAAEEGAATPAFAEVLPIDTLWPPILSDSASTSYMLPNAHRHGRDKSSLPPWRGLAVPSGTVGFPVPTTSPASTSHQPSSLQHIQHSGHHANGGMDATSWAPSVLAPAPSPHAFLYNSKLDQLESFSVLMTECIRAAMGAAALRGVAAAPKPVAAAGQLLELAAGLEARHRRATGPFAQRHSFIPSAEWLSQVAAAAVGAADNITAAQVVKLLADMEALAPKLVECHDGPRHWLDAAGQAAVEDAVRRHTLSGAWTPQQAVSIAKALIGNCAGPPGEAMCALLEELLLACDDAKQDMELLCALLQEAVELASPADSSCGCSSSHASAVGTELSDAHRSLVRVALNRAIYLVGSSAAGSAAGSSPLSSADWSSASADGSSRVRLSPAASARCAREFLFERYPRLLQAARRFEYPLQSLCLEEYAEELCDHLATAPGRELVAVGPEGLTRVLEAVASTSCCHDPQWAAAFERACLTMLDVQFSVGYTHPKRWLGLLNATVASLPFPMPALAAAIKALMVRLCDINRYTKYFWELLPLVGALERRAAVAAAQSAGARHAQHVAYAGQPLWVPTELGSFGRGNGVQSYEGSGRGPHGSMRQGGGNAQAGRAGSAAGSQRPMVPPPDLSRYLVSEEEYSQWCEELGRRLALSMACLSDQDRVAQLSVLGIGSRP